MENRKSLEALVKREEVRRSKAIDADISDTLKSAVETTQREIRKAFIKSKKARAKFKMTEMIDR